LTRILCVDFGSTFTKAVLLDPSDGSLLAAASVPTTIGTDVLDGYRSICQTIAAAGFPPADEVLACSSAGGGLRLAVVGYERSVTAEAGYRVGLSAGAKIVHVASGPMTTAQVAVLRATRPDVILLVGGTDGGNAEVLLHNGSRLAKARMGAPVVVAGNVEARAGVALALESAGRRFILTDNVLPQIGVINPDGARAAIRQMFLRHVIGGKHLSKGPQFAAMVRAATPDAMLRGVETLAAAADGDGGDVLVFDIGGATTDVYSVISPEGEDATLRKEVVAPLWHARTVEGDLGMRWNARGVTQGQRWSIFCQALTWNTCRPGRPASRPTRHTCRTATASSSSTWPWPGWPRSPPSGATRAQPSPGTRPARWPGSLTSSARAGCCGTVRKPSRTRYCGPSSPTLAVAGRCPRTRARRLTRHTSCLRPGFWQTLTVTASRWPSGWPEGSWLRRFCT